MQKIHKDKLDQELKVGDIVCYPSYQALRIGRVIKLNPKMLAITNLDHPSNYKARVYANQTIRLNSPETMLWILAHSK